MPQIFQAKDFLNRQELENYIKAKVGADSNLNRSAGHQITGKKQELERLNLSDTDSVFGIACFITDEPSTKKVDDRIKNK